MWEVADDNNTRLACKVVAKESLKTKKAKTKVCSTDPSSCASRGLLLCIRVRLQAQAEPRMTDSVVIGLSGLVHVQHVAVQARTSRRHGALRKPYVVEFGRFVCEHLSSDCSRLPYCRFWKFDVLRLTLT